MRIAWLIIVILVIGWNALNTSTATGASAVQMSQLYNGETATFLALIALTLAFQWAGEAWGKSQAAVGAGQPGPKPTGDTDPAA